MAAYQWAALGLMITLGFVVHSTMELNRFRKRLAIPKRLLNFRDFEVWRRPDTFDPQEVRLVRVNWGGCVASFGLFALLLAFAPEHIWDDLQLPDPTQRATATSSD